MLLKLGSLLGLIAAGAALAASPPAPTERVFTVKGVIRGPYQEGAIRIQHEAIPGYMPAMTMSFYADASDVRDLASGDIVEFEFHVGQRSHATNFRRLGREAAAASPAAEGAATPRRRLREGDPVPPFMLEDQDGRRMTEADLRGRRTVLTFIFTRCPVPEFCPLMGKKFAELQRELSREPVSGGNAVQLLSISIDPAYDRPPVLRAYGETLGADFRRWRFVTGTPEAIGNLTRLFAVHTERNAGTLDHTLATALVGPDGRVVEIWRGNAWKPGEVLQRLRAGPEKQ